MLSFEGIIMYKVVPTVCINIEMAGHDSNIYRHRPTSTIGYSFSVINVVMVIKCTSLIKNIIMQTV